MTTTTDTQAVSTEPLHTNACLPTDRRGSRSLPRKALIVLALSIAFALCGGLLASTAATQIAKLDAVPGAVSVASALDDLGEGEAEAASWRRTWYGPIYAYNWWETKSLADSPYNIPQGSANPFAYLAVTYRFWWSQTAKTALVLGKCLGIHFTGSPQIINC